MSLYIGRKKVTGIQSFIQENARWGQIEGTLSDQTDLAEALANKYDASNPDGFITQDALAPYQPRAQEIIILETSGSISLLDNTINSINVSDNVTFTLPLIEDNTKFHQILVQMYMASVKAINLGTTYYINEEAPDLSKNGYYTIIYEYDSIKNEWAVGVLKKARA